MALDDQARRITRITITPMIPVVPVAPIAPIGQIRRNNPGLSFLKSWLISQSFGLPVATNQSVSLLEIEHPLGPCPQCDARPETNRPLDKIATSQGFNSASGIPTYCSCPNGNPHAASRRRPKLRRPRLSCAKCWPRPCAIPRSPSRSRRRRPREVVANPLLWPLLPIAGP
jgi:hypothetical protein